MLLLNANVKQNRTLSVNFQFIGMEKRFDLCARTKQVKIFNCTLKSS